MHAVVILTSGTHRGVTFRMTGQLGFHHVTAVCSNEERTTSFYTLGLGMRLLRRTVNYDELTMLEIQFCGVETSSASLMTFLVDPKAPRGVQGTGQISNLVFQVHASTLEQWSERLRSWGVRMAGFASSFGERCLCFSDPDGLPICLVEYDRDAPTYTQGQQMRLGALRSIELQLQGYELTARFIANLLGFNREEREGAVTRFSDSTYMGSPILDLLSAPGHRAGKRGAGVATHLAFNVGEVADLQQYRDRAVALGLDVTPVLDRYYFSAIYFEIPGGIRLGMVADTFGIEASDRPAGDNGLALPPWLEPQRSRIERRLAGAQD